MNFRSYKSALLILFYGWVLGCLLYPSNTNATHIVGGELNYRCLGGNTYEITLRVFRDCEYAQASFDNPAAVGIFDANNNRVKTLYIPFTGADTIEPTEVSNCMILPPDVCVDRTSYVDTTQLPPSPGGYQLAYQRCCRNHSVKNIIRPDTTGATFYARIPDTSLAKCNSNPVINEWPPVYVCNELEFTFDHSATDYNGDSLAYKLCKPYDGASLLNPKPQPPFYPPYDYITWKSPYTTQSPMNGSPAMSIDVNTGRLTVTPTDTGQYVVGVCIEEYRNGNLLGKTKRDFQFNVVHCRGVVDIVLKSGNITLNSGCEDSSVTFGSKSIGVDEFSWDFGDPSTNNDTSSLESPTYTYPDSGKFEVTLIGEDTTGCKDTATRMIDIYPLPPAQAQPDTAICRGDTVSLQGRAGAKYQWYPTPSILYPDSSETPAFPDTTTQYTLKVTSNKGCVNYDSTEITVNPIPDLSVMPQNDSISCYGDTIQLDATSGDTVSYDWSPGTGLSDSTVEDPLAYPADYTHYKLEITDSNNCKNRDTVSIYLIPDISNPITATDTYVCINDSVILATKGDSIYNEVTDFSWTPGHSMTDTTLPNPVAFPDTTTTYYLTTTNKCFVNQDTTTMKVKPIPVMTIRPDTGICRGDSVRLHTTGAIDYFWTPNEFVSDSSVHDPLAWPDSTTQYQAFVTDTNRCTNTDSTLITVYPLPNINSTPDTNMCPWDTIQLTVTGGSTYTWQPNSYISDIDTSNPYVSPPTSQNYYVLGIDSNECKNRDTTHVTVLDSVYVEASPDKTTICYGDSLLLNVTGDSSIIRYDWTPPICSNCDNIIVSPDTTQMYHVTGTNGCFDSQDSIFVQTVNLQISAHPDTAVCKQQPVQLRATDGLSYRYTWTPGRTLSDAKNRTPIAYPNHTKTYRVEVRDSNDCRETDSVRVEVYKTPVAVFFPEPDLTAVDAPIHFNNKSQRANQYTWDFGNGETSFKENPKYAYPKQDTYEVCLTAMTTASPCRDSTCERVGVKKVNIGVPNAFSPNGDGKNDILYVEGTGIVKMTFQVYNRWGQKVFETHDPDKGWDGTYNGKPQEMETYVWQLSATMLGGTTVRREGNVTLLR